jgi:hypothetical protein
MAHGMDGDGRCDEIRQHETIPSRPSPRHGNHMHLSIGKRQDQLTQTTPLPLLAARGFEMRGRWHNTYSIDN